ncbi:MAG TPA: glycoside hydrolase family 76 protein [Solirubrobacteraceae bacterium]|nr:glycoside hydrolase family 76 protein [Solirubrobacteraceae bacterium]
MPRKLISALALLCALLGAPAHAFAYAPARAAKQTALRGNPGRAQLAYTVMQRHFYLQGSGLYRGEPYSFLWPFSQALAATVSLANVPGQQRVYAHDLHVRLFGLRSYLDASNSDAPLGTFTSTLAAFDGAVAPPAGVGGAKFYDDNEWVGIELMRVYKLTHDPATLATAKQIMAFVMEGWSTDPQLACPGGIPFSNAATNTDRNTVTDGPAAELGVQLYRATGVAQYLQFAQQAYEWTRKCLLQPSGMYADHIRQQGVVDPTLWSYNQGSMIGAGALLYQATDNPAYLFQARQTAKAAVGYFNTQALVLENPFFASVYFRNMLYLDAITHDPPGKRLPQLYANYMWQNLRLSSGLFLSGSPSLPSLLTQAAVIQIYTLLSTSPATYF